LALLPGQGGCVVTIAELPPDTARGDQLWCQPSSRMMAIFAFGACMQTW